MRTIRLVPALSLLWMEVAAHAATKDLDPPEFRHTPVLTAVQGEQVAITTLIEDQSPIFAPMLWWRYVGQEAFQPMDLKQQGERWVASIPANKPIEYWLEAYDELGNGPAREGSPERPFKIQLTLKGVAPKLSSGDPLTATLSLNTEPPGAMVKVIIAGQTRVVKTPATIEKVPPTASLPITFVLGGYESKEVTAVVEAGKVVTVMEKLEPKATAPTLAPASAAVAEAPPAMLPAPPHPTMGSFATWSASKRSAGVLGALRKVAKAAGDLPRLREQLTQEKQKNDASVIEPRFWTEPVYPELTGSFIFGKILDRNAGEALFSANDGLFVLRLTEGDSFSAAPGQLVRMTVHSRGEKMLMTTGQRLPVFISGASPTVPRMTSGFQPNRQREKQLAKQIETLGRALHSGLEGPLPGRDVAPAGSLYRLKAAPKSLRVEVEFRVDDSLELILISDATDAVFCLSEVAPSCPVAREFVPLEWLTSKVGGPTMGHPLSVPRATAIRWGAPTPAYVPTEQTTAAE